MVKRRGDFGDAAIGFPRDVAGGDVAPASRADLRNPLNSVSVNLQVLEQEADTALKAETRDAMRRAVASVTRMSSIVNRLIGLSTAAYSTFLRKPLSMTVLVAEEYDRLRSMEPARDVAFDLNQLNQVEADETLVRILVLNLLSNALQSTREQSSPRISVSSAQAGGVPVFCVRDNGCGLDGERAKRLFEPFETSSADGYANGLGLGLSIASRVVKRHGGRIWADGIAGREASIYFTLAPDTGDQPDDSTPA
jgi:signal transduction histidine kinase